MRRYLLMLSLVATTGNLMAQIKEEQQTEKNKKVVTQVKEKPKREKVKQPVQSTKQKVKEINTNTSLPNSNGHFIPISITQLKNCWVYLGCHYGKNKNIADSAFLNAQGRGVFKGKNKLPGGIYFVVPPARYLAFEVLMDKEQRFSIIVTDTSDWSKVKITGSADNTIFQDYNNFLAAKVPALNALQRELAMATTKEDSARINSLRAAKNEELNSYRENIIKNKPNSMLANFFQTMKRPSEPKPLPRKSNGEVDSLAVWRFVKESFWDGVDFSKDYLVRTPFFEPKLDEYYKYYVLPEADSVIADVSYMMAYAQSAKEMHKFLLGKFTDKYINPEIMGQDKVFIYLFENYYSKGDTTWLSIAQRKYIFERAYSLMANQIGEPAPILDLTGIAGNTIPLYSLESNFTFVCIWDPNCGHCKEQIPRLDSMYKAKWKNIGVKIYGVNVDEKLMKEWQSFIAEKELDKEAWVHVYQTKTAKDAEQKSGQPSYRQLYDAFVTPTIVLLDKDKRIIGKKLAIEQFDEIIQNKLKKQKNN